MVSAVSQQTDLKTVPARTCQEVGLERTKRAKRVAVQQKLPVYKMSN